MSQTVNDLISGAMRLIGALGAGETPSTDEQTDIILTLNNLIEVWNAEGLSVYEIVNFQNALTAATASFNIGAGATINTPRPIRIVGAGIIANSIRNELDIISAGEFAAIKEKGLSGNLPLKLYYDAAFPTGKIYLWPIASGTPTLDLWMWQQLTAVVNPTDPLALPPAHWRALRYNLALDLLPEFGRTDDPGLLALIKTGAQESKDLLKASNQRAITGMTSAPAPAASDEAAAA
jgi:hypothetical protein